MKSERWASRQPRRSELWALHVATEDRTPRRKKGQAYEANFSCAARRGAERETTYSAWGKSLPCAGHSQTSKLSRRAAAGAHAGSETNCLRYVSQNASRME